MRWKPLSQPPTRSRISTSRTVAPKCVPIIHSFILSPSWIPSASTLILPQACVDTPPNRRLPAPTHLVRWILLLKGKLSYFAGKPTGTSTERTLWREPTVRPPSRDNRLLKSKFKPSELRTYAHFCELGLPSWNHPSPQTPVLQHVWKYPCITHRLAVQE
jgi:hypothetical protein